MQEFGPDGYVSGPAPLCITVCCERDRTVVLHIAGDLDTCTAEQFRQVIDQQLADRPEHLCVDLADVAFLDAAGVHALGRCYVDAADLGCRLRLDNPQPLVHQVLHIVGMAPLFGLAAPPTPAGRKPSGYRSPDSLPLTSVAETIKIAKARVAEAQATRRRSLAISAATRELFNRAPQAT